MIVHQSLCAAAKLGIADLLENGALTCSEIAGTLSADEDALYRILRFLSGEGVFREIAPRRFENSALSELLRTDVPGSLRSVLLHRGSSRYVSALSMLTDRIRKGPPVSGDAVGGNLFELLRGDPNEARIFDDAMTAISTIWARDIATTYDFGCWGSLMDVGGGMACYWPRS
jgi:hypothetical protein